MNETVLIIGEVIVGLAVLLVLTAVLTVWATRLLVKSSPADIVQERYARGDLTREQYEQMREDLGMSAMSEDTLHAPQPNGRDAGAIPSSRRIR